MIAETEELQAVVKAGVDLAARMDKEDEEAGRPGELREKLTEAWKKHVDKINNSHASRILP